MNCPRCEHDNPPAQKFCGECGASLRNAGTPAASVADLQAENERLRSSLAEATDRATEASGQQGATSEILRVISESPTDVQPVFDAIVRHAVTLCDGVASIVVRYDGTVMRLAAYHDNVSAESRERHQTEYPRPPDRTVPLGAAIVDREIVHVPNLQASTRFAGSPVQRSGRASMIAVPLLRHGEAIGAIGITRDEPEGFSDRDIALLQIFADQAVIAIENVRLFKELQTRNRDLSEALDKQTATSEILRAISRSPIDVQAVFDAIVESAVRLLRGFVAAISRLADDDLHLVAFTRTDPAGDAAVRSGFPQPLASDRTHARAVRDRVLLNVADAQSDPQLPEAIHALAVVRGYQSLVVVPLLRHDEAIGAISVTRREPGGFTVEEISLLQTFADQAVIAIENVRLFTELQERNTALTEAHGQISEALDQQTATAEILRVISQSPTDVQPVFDAIADSALRLCEAKQGNVFLFDGKLIHLAAVVGTDQQATDTVRRSFPQPPGQGSATARAIRGRGAVMIPDVLDDGEYGLAELSRRADYRSVMSVPMLRGAEPIGAITVTRAEPGPFPDKQRALLQTFADQAVIAIENVRLFNELESANRDLAAASQHKSEFLANMSHELRTPLNAVIGFSEVLSEGMFGDLNDKQDEYARDIHASGQHLLSLINDILDLSKIEAGRMELELTDFHLPTALDNALTLVRERAGRRGMAVQTRIDERLGQIQADERKIRQVVLNLLSNAIKFTPEGGRIDIEARPRDESVEVSVTDTGIGIAPEDQEAVFEEFRQVGRSDKKAEGTGLGLTLCRKFIELHGGRIWAKSDIGHGSTFTFTIPLRRHEK